MTYASNTAHALKHLLQVFTTRAQLAPTPRRLVWRRNKARLFHYQSAALANPRRLPLLIVYSPIGRPTILDLYPGHSFVDWMRSRGVDVFLLDWGSPGPEDRSLGLRSYVIDYLPRAVRTVKRLAGSPECSLLGWSVGGLFAAIYAALFPEALRNLVLVTTPLDFEGGKRNYPTLPKGSVGWGTLPMASFADGRFAIDNTLISYGNVPGEMIAFGALAIDPFHAAIRPNFALWAHLSDPGFVQHWHAVRTWATDLVPVTRALFHDLCHLHRSNCLMRNDLMLGTRRVDLARIRARLLNIVAIDDRISPPCQSEGLLNIVGSRDRQNLRVRGTHVESMAGLRAPYETWPIIFDWLAEDPHSAGAAAGARILPFPAR